MTDPARLVLLCALSAGAGARLVLFPPPGRAAHEVHAQPRPRDPTIIVWLTKDVPGDQVTFADTPRDDGVIAERRVPDPAPDDVPGIPTRSGGSAYTRFHGPGEWHRTREAAVARAEAMRLERIAELRAEIEGLEGKEF